MKLIAKEIIGEHAISMQSGNILYEQIKKNIASDRKVQIDFSGVKFFASPFFNASIGYLLKDIPIELLQEKIDIINLTEVGRRTLNLVISNAINFYSSRKNEDNIKIFSRNAGEI